MAKLNTCKIQFKFDFGLVDNRFMQTSVITSNNIYSIIPDKNKSGIVEFDIDLPTQVMLKFTGKNSNTDTLIDDNGNIVGDMYVKITAITLDKFKLNKIFLHQKMKLLTENKKEITTSYIGFNGSIFIDMPESTVFSQYLLMNNIL